MTVGELRAALQKHPDDMPVVVLHYGDVVPASAVKVVIFSPMPPGDDVPVDQDVLVIQ